MLHALFLICTVGVPQLGSQPAPPGAIEWPNGVISISSSQLFSPSHVSSRSTSNRMVGDVLVVFAPPFAADVIAKLTSSGAFSSVTGENILFLRVFVYYASVVCLRTEILW